MSLLAIMAGLIGFSLIAGCSWWVQRGADGHVYGERDVPAAPVALVLGAQVYPDFTPSPFLAARLDVALRLYRTGKVRVILVSGDHRQWHYDEPGVMWQYLVDRGVPGSKVVADYAGLDTYDSCARARRIFGVTRAIVVTQAFHVPRAVTLCRRLGVTADGVGDTTMRRYHKPWIIASMRENGAAVKAIYDLTTGRDPVYLGPHETSVEDGLRP